MKAGYGESPLTDPIIWKAVTISKEDELYLKYIEELRQQICNLFCITAKNSKRRLTN